MLHLKTYKKSTAFKLTNGIWFMCKMKNSKWFHWHFVIEKIAMIVKLLTFPFLAVSESTNILEDN